MEQEQKSCRITAIGGQAVIEGVMMRGKRLYAMAVRKPDQELELVVEKLTPASDKFPPLGWPIVRGVVSFISSMVMGMKLITRSAELAGLEETGEPETKFEKFLADTFGDKLMDVMLAFSVVLALGLSVLLFIFLPVWISSFANRLIGSHTWALSMIEGVVKLGIFIGYMLLISRMKDIQRLFAYHGAEHKTINCFEHHEELTVENVRRYSRLHKRCGTSFLIFVMLISILVFIFVRTNAVWTRVGFKLLLVPLIAGISYEVIKWAGRSDSALVQIISWPGMLMQKITTAEPDDGQIEAAIAAMTEVLKHEPE